MSFLMLRWLRLKDTMERKKWSMSELCLQLRASCGVKQGIHVVPLRDDRHWLIYAHLLSHANDFWIVLVFHDNGNDILFEFVWVGEPDPALNLLGCNLVDFVRAWGSGGWVYLIHCSSDSSASPPQWYHEIITLNNSWSDPIFSIISLDILSG